MSDNLARLASHVKNQCGVELLAAPCEEDKGPLSDELASVAELYAHSDFAEPDPPVCIPFGMMRLLPLNKALALWEELAEIEDEDVAEFFDETDDSGRIRAVVHHRQRFPIAYDETASAYLYVDAVPGPKGTVGQAIASSAEASFVWLARSIDAFFALLCDRLENQTLSFAKMPAEYGSGFWLVDGEGNPVDATRLAQTL